VRQDVGCSCVGGGTRHAVGRRIHALALYLKTNQLFSYEWLQGAFADLFAQDRRPARTGGKECVCLGS
jgi:hypothetical protein